MRRLTTLLAIGWALAGPLRAQPAAPPTDPSLDCPLYGIPENERMLAASAASRRLTDVPAGDEQRGSVALDIILSNLPRCAEAARWTENQRELAQQYLLFQLAREDMRRRYAAQNVDLGFIDAAVAAGPRAMLQFDTLVGRVRAQGVTGSRPDSAEDVTFIYLELARQAEEIRRGFSDPQFRPR